MQYRQTTKNPFEQRADARPFQAALRARAGEHHEFRHPVRLNRKKKQTLGHYTSTIMQVSLPYHSALELAGMQWLDLQPCVRAFWPQPLTFVYEMGTELRRYTPDIGVELSSRRAFMVEVKPRSDAESQTNRQRWRYIAPTLKHDGYDLAFLVDQFLQGQPLASHLRAIQRFKGPVYDETRIWELQTRLDREHPWTIREILPVLTSHGFAEDEFFSLVINRHLYLNLRQPLGGSSRVWVPGRAPQTKIWDEYHAA